VHMCAYGCTHCLEGILAVSLSSGFSLYSLCSHLNGPSVKCVSAEERNGEPGFGPSLSLLLLMSSDLGHRLHTSCDSSPAQICGCPSLSTLQMPPLSCHSLQTGRDALTPRCSGGSGHSGRLRVSLKHLLYKVPTLTSSPSVPVSHTPASLGPIIQWSESS
jgi:hypothetical protein